MRRLPHARGGVSRQERAGRGRRLSSPRTWGCFSPRFGPARTCRVFPTHVGVFLNHEPALYVYDSLPHARGGVSHEKRGHDSTPRSSPRTWGCFYKIIMGQSDLRVFPTHVGVFPRPSRTPWPTGSLPHARGGVSFERVYVAFSGGSSPRTWGCFYYEGHGVVIWRVFPTHVGVFLFNMPLADMETRLPHARGGVSGVERGHSL